MVVRGEDSRHLRVLRPAGLRNHFCDVIPTAARVPGHLRLTIIRSDPDHAGLRGRFGDRGDRAMLDGRARQADLRGIIGRQVGTDLLPGLASISRAEQNLRSGVERLRVMRRHTQWRDPVEAEHWVTLWPRWRDGFTHASLLIEPRMASELLRVIKPAAISRVHLIIHSVADAYRRPIFQSNAARPAIARSFPRFVILQSRVDVVRFLPIHGQRVDFAESQVRRLVACLAAVVIDEDAAVRPGDNAVGILRIYPDSAEIAEGPSKRPRLCAARSRPGFAAVF